MLKQMNRRTVAAAIGAAAVAMPTLALGKAPPLGNSPEQRIKDALDELARAFEAYYRDAKLKVVFNEVRPENLADGSVAVAMILADRLDDPRVSRTADNPYGINEGYRGFQIGEARRLPI